MSDRFFINMPIPADKYEAVCAVLAGVVGLSVTAQARASTAAPEIVRAPVTADDNGAGPTGAAPTGAEDQSQASGDAGASQAAIDPNDIDAHGHPWNPELHAGTKGKTKDGLWRMKVGVTRPDPLPGFPKGDGAQSGDTGTSSATPTPSATSSTATAAAPAPTGTSTEDEDEFAAFREAAAKSDATDNAAAASVAPRQFSDADLGALCNQAAVKLGDPAPIKEIIAKYVPEGQVQHSRNIPADKRDDFAKEVEAKAGIEFAA